MQVRPFFELDTGSPIPIRGRSHPGDPWSAAPVLGPRLGLRDPPPGSWGGGLVSARRLGVREGDHVLAPTQQIRTDGDGCVGAVAGVAGGCDDCRTRGQVLGRL